MKTFPKGGVHPPENKLTASSAIQKLIVSGSVTIPVSQHLGAAATVIVNKGDFIKTGQLIATANGFVSANIHSSVSGKVSRIDNIPDCAGFKQSAVTIDIEGDDWIDTIDISDKLIKDIQLSPDEILKKIRESGIVGMGGASFPSHVKLTVPEGKKC